MQIVAEIVHLTNQFPFWTLQTSGINFDAISLTALVGAARMLKLLYLGARQ